MDNIIKAFVDNNEILKKFFEYPKEELKLIRMHINLELRSTYTDKNQVKRIKMPQICSYNSYNCIEHFLAFMYQVDSNFVSVTDTFDKIKEYDVCKFCNCKHCLRRSVNLLINEVDNYNKANNTKIKYIDVIDYLFNTKKCQLNPVQDKNIFKDIDLIDLLYIYTILELDLVDATIKDQNIEGEFLDITEKQINEYYINILLGYYKSKKKAKRVTINLQEINEIYKEKDQITRIYKIAIYYKYLIKYKNIDIISKLKEMLNKNNEIDGIVVRNHYFIYRYFKKVEDLPYSRKTKEKIYNILNYILNNWKNQVPYIPINILIYSNDKNGVEKITNIIGEFMWFFCYLPSKLTYYNESINNIILDKFTLNKLYYTNESIKQGVLLLHNFENLLYIDKNQQNLILNILTDEIEKNNRNICTIIYGERKSINQLLDKHPKLSKILLNLELEIDNLDANHVYELTIEKLEKTLNLSDEEKEKIYNYINATYEQSPIRNIEYIDNLYNTIILNMNKKFSAKNKQTLKLIDIPEAYNIKDLPEIMKDMNSLIGLKEIKEQINDLVALLKFNKKANLDIKDFNLHMCFLGNPGTGKTTVGRLITEIFYNLGYISQNKLTEVTAKDLIAEYLGQTSGKTYNVIKSALGGVLFIDEAYSLTLGSKEGSQYGLESLATLIKLMEDYKDKLIVIFAGYKDEMEEFLELNSGLISRIGYKISFPDYSVDELLQIFSNLVKKNKLEITEEALKKLRMLIAESSKCKGFGNGRYIHNIFQKILIEHAKNITNSNSKKDYYIINENDINYEKLISENKNKKIGF